MNQPENRPHVVVVDDEPDMCELLAMRLEFHGYRVSIAHTIAGGVACLERDVVDAIIADLRLEHGSGLDVLDEVQKRSLDIPVVILTAHGTIETAVEAMSRGAYGFLTKPFHDHELLQKLAHAVERVRLRREVAGLRTIVGGSDDDRLLGTSARIAEVRDVIGRVARTEATVLLLGASGTGKELAARSLHRLSARASKPFVAINCGALPADLLESELFGHVRGAFTGAVKDKEGVFAAAGRGTLFLDEVGEAPPAVQVRLLRVLQERRFTPIGSTVEREAECRIVAATNRDLRAEVAAGRFREDLFYRLHVVPVAMPPLADRVEDIPLLAKVFLNRAAARHGVPPPQLASSALALLQAHRWPGNVRELANVCEAALLLVRSDSIERDDIEAVLPGTTAPAAAAVDPDGDDGADDADAVLSTPSTLPTLREARDAAERSYLDQLLRHTGGNVSRAARIADRNRTDLHELLKRHGLTPTTYRS
jgi:two-component system, NtrC family, response regulator GlrR